MSLFFSVELQYVQTIGSIDVVVPPAVVKVRIRKLVPKVLASIVIATRWACRRGVATIRVAIL